MPPRSVHEIPTPALIVDAAALDRNIARMAAFFSTGPCRLRPHVKAHKTPEIARRQLAAGSCVGLTCATLGEAEHVVDLTDDILIANELIGPGKCARAVHVALALRERAGTNGRLTGAVDSRDGLQTLSDAARQAGVTIGVLVDINVGQNRCGVAPGAAALALAQAVGEYPNLALRGVMGYEGHVQPIRERAARESSARAAMAQLVETSELIRAAGLACDVVSAGGTGTYDISGRVPGVTEIQAGSYALMDTDYREVGVGFEQAFWVLGTVVSAPIPDRCVIDAGHKATTKDHGMPSVADLEGALVTALNDEHAVIDLSHASRRPRIGDRLRLVPSHTDPTINLHDDFYVVEGDRVIDVWPIARGYRRA
jgi:D-serine deaminase-like pyridoxal phosphate-dependent protein